MNNQVGDEIIRFLATSKLAETTRELYGLYLRQWKDHITDKKISQKRAGPYDLAQWLAGHAQWSDSTKRSACCAVRAFYAWRYGKLHSILNFNVQGSDSGPQRTPDAAKLEKLLAIFDTTTPRGRCYVAAITLMLDTGLRASEVCRLDLDHLDVEQGVLSVLRKRGKWKPAKFFDYARSCMSSWLAVRSTIALPETRTVFVVTYGPTTGRPMNRNGLRIAFNRFGKLAGIGKLSPHDLRRAFATMSIDNGASSRLVQAAGGWEDIGMLERYTQALNLEKMREFSPVDNLMGVHPLR